MAHSYNLVYLGSSIEEVVLCILKYSFLAHAPGQSMTDPLQ